MKEPRYAPGFEGAMAWLNVDRPIEMDELRGCVVILDFWTYCCVNCMHVLPVLRELEQRFAEQPLVVIGVHSGKFAAEQEPDHILEAIGRYGVPHPVVVDDDMVIWSRFGIRSWPTLVVVRPDGTIASVAPGEPDLETLDAFVRREMDGGRQAGILAKVPPRIRSAPPPEHRPLNYPGKVRGAPDGRVVVSDSGHHRVLVLAPNGSVQHTIGSGLRGWQDGSFAEAAFDDPQGTCWVEDALYIADVRNHVIRRADLSTQTITTVAGTGVLGTAMPEGRVEAARCALRSPWDLCPVGDAIYVAMAGSHQIWRMHLADQTIEVYAGTGVEALLDGPCETSAWAQPSGLSEREGTLFVADSETSAVRAIDLESDRVRTLIGQGLFDFGDDEGLADTAMLQHCLGVEAVEDGVLIADTYNGKIKHLSDAAGDGPGKLRTVLGGLSEPGSVCVVADGTWLITDTNDHRVTRFRQGKLRDLPIRGAPEPKIGALRPASAPKPPAESVQGWFTSLIELPEGLGLRPGDGWITLLLHAPPGMALSEGAPLEVELEVSRRSDLLLLTHPRLDAPTRGDATQLVSIDVRVGELPDRVIEAELLASLRFVACAAGDSAACYPGTARLRLPIRLIAYRGQKELQFEIPLPAPEA